MGEFVDALLRAVPPSLTQPDSPAAPQAFDPIRPEAEEMEEPETEESFGSRAASLRRLKVARGYGALLDRTKGS